MNRYLDGPARARVWLLAISGIGISMVVALTGVNRQGRVDRLEKQVAELKKQTADLRAATILTSREYWYTVENGRVSSEQDGRGRIVDFDPGSSQPLNSGMKNKMVRFTRPPGESVGIMAGGLLNYTRLE